MVFDAHADRAAGTSARSVSISEPTGTAFAAWAVAFAMGALIHSWQGIQATPVIGAVGVLTGVCAVAVLLRPTAPARLMVLLGALLVEAITDLPDLVNHLVVIAILALTLIPWWLVQLWRAPAQAHDPAYLYARVGPYLRLAFILTFAFAALAKLNAGFLDVAGTCSTWILQSVPFITLPAFLTPAAIYGTIGLELSIPVFLLLHRTRPLAVVLGFGFHLLSAFAGHASFSGFAWCFYVLFLPPTMIANAVGIARDAVPARARELWRAAVARTPVTLAAFAATWFGAALAVSLVLPGGLQWKAHWMTAAAICAVWMAVGGWLLYVLRTEWVGAPGPRASLRVTNGLMLAGVGLLVLTAAMPYLGLKTRAAFTMFSNVRTEPGEWNHLLLPESMRIFGWQDGVVQFRGTDDPVLAAAITEHAEDERTVLLEARRLVETHPDATVRYTLDGVERVASPVSADDVLGVPLSAEQEWLGAMRPYTDGPRCQH